MLGNGADLGADGHEVMVAFPAWNEMEMEVVGDAGSGGSSQIEANIDTMGFQVTAEDGGAGGQHRHEPAALVLGEFGEVGEMPAGSQEQVAIGVRKAVEQDNGRFVAKKEEMRFFLGREARGLEQAPARRWRDTENMLHPPGSPKNFHGVCGSSRMRADRSSPASRRAKVPGAP